MFSGSDEFVLREISDDLKNIHYLITLLLKNDIELEFANCLKLYELGKTDEELFQRQYEWYMREKGRVDQYIIKKKK